MEQELLAVLELLGLECEESFELSELVKLLDDEDEASDDDELPELPEELLYLEYFFLTLSLDRGLSFEDFLFDELDDL